MCVEQAARKHGLLYGITTALMALLTGWFASVVSGRTEYRFIGRRGCSRLLIRPVS